VPSFTSLPDYPKIEPFATTPAKLIALVRDKPMDFEPGERFRVTKYIQHEWQYCFHDGRIRDRETEKLCGSWY
jgi:hypothetical protein